MRKSIVSINLNSDQVLQFYKRQKERVRAVADDGTSISLPFDIIARFVTHHGIYGRFEISYGSDGKFKGIRRVG
ncbi:DUF2835 family protein [Sansalvadorimonas verongulae]|uniref:DUF2835 family protein n=1 Tax=Sansalvadorimonas verongulae TaxID=2172824 RepID=UPI0012BB8672|nr:DUF2835 family protein [Sansalvadorimonas verongulae]MTI14583.1 DUF2835 family protein [Sansalvadorimonas verongulae]